MSPRVVLKSTKLRLTYEQELALMDHVQKRFTDIRVEMGWISDLQYDGFLEERRQAWAEYQNDFSHRKNYQKYGDLYQTFNDASFNIPKRAARVYAARAREALLNSQPFAGIMPEGPEDAAKPPEVPGLPPVIDPIKQADRFWNRKLDDAEANIHFRDGVETAAVGGEVVFKITKRLADDQDEAAEKAIWLDGTGAPLRDARGRYVFADEEFEADPDALEGEVLKRDPSVVKMPDAALSEELYPAESAMPRRVLDIKPIDYRNFICSPTAEDIHTTDYIAQTFDLTLDQLWELTQGTKLSAEAKAWRDGLKSQSVQAKTESGQPNETMGEKERGASAPILLHLAESWLLFDCRNTGKCDKICVLWDVTTGYPIHYDLQSEVSATGKRPFEVSRIIPVKNRWYGAGFYKLLSNEHAYIDRQTARLEIRTSTSGRLTYYNKGTLEDVEGGWDIELNSPRIYTATSLLKEGQDPIKHIELPAMDDRIFDERNMRMQQAQLMSGSMTPGDAAAVKLNPSETLGGQEMLANESELMSSDTTQDLRRGIELALKQSIVAVFSDFDLEEARELLGVENGNALAEWVKSHKPRTLLNRVKLLMVRAKSRMQIEANKQAITIVAGNKSWSDVVALVQQGMLPAEVAESWKPLYKSILDASDIELSDSIISLPKAMPPPTVPGNVQPMTSAVPPNASPAANAA
jgi:hypothetical protein